MGRSITLALLVVVSAASTAFSGENDLFSKVRVNSVFQTSTEDSTTKTPVSSSSKKATSIAGIGHLSDLTRASGFETKEIGSRAISTKVQVGQWSVPVVLTISENKSKISVALLLSTLKTGNELPTQQLLALLNANRTYAPAFFAYSTKQQRTELHQILENQDLTSKSLNSAIVDLGKIAEKTTSLWQIATVKAQTPAPRTIEPTPASKPSTVTTTSLEGKWSAVRSKTEAFAIQLKSDSTFVLVYVNNGQQNRSTGKFTFEGQLLTLNGDSGSPIKATISSQSSTEFHFLLENAADSAKLIFKKAS